MKKDFFKKHLRQIISILISIILTAAITFLEMNFSSKDYGGQKKFLRFLSDGCFFSGLIFLIFAMLSFARRHGGFDLLFFTGRKIKENFRRSKNDKEKKLSYYDFILERKEKSYPPVWHIFIIAGLLILLSLIFAGFSLGFKMQ